MFARFNKCMFIINFSLIVLILTLSFFNFQFRIGDWLSWFRNLEFVNEFHELSDLFYNFENIWNVEFTGELSDILSALNAFWQSVINFYSITFTILKIIFICPLKDIYSTISLIRGSV